MRLEDSRRCRAARIVAVVMAFAMLFAQGLRLCIHTTAVSGGNDTPAAVSALVHLENNLGSSDDADGNAAVRDVPLSLDLVKLVYDLVFAVILTAFVVFLLPERTANPQPLAEFHPRLGGVPGLRPPLRAPPR